MNKLTIASILAILSILTFHIMQKPEEVRSEPTIVAPATNELPTADSKEPSSEAKVIPKTTSSVPGTIEAKPVIAPAVPPTSTNAGPEPVPQAAAPIFVASAPVPVPQPLPPQASTPSPMPEPAQAVEPSNALPVAPPTITVVSPIPGKGLGRDYIASDVIVDESNYVEIGAVLKDGKGNELDTPVMTVTTTDPSQNTTLQGTGNYNVRVGKYYPFHYEFHSAGQHTITFSAEGVSVSVEFNVK